jgi:hypothetical protein
VNRQESGKRPAFANSTGFAGRLALALLLCSGMLAAAEFGTVRVHAYDGETGAPLAQVQVTDLATKAVVLTDSSGDAFIPLQRYGDFNLELSAVGYVPTSSHKRSVRSQRMGSGEVGGLREGDTTVDRLPMFADRPRPVRGQVVDFTDARPLVGAVLLFNSSKRAVTDSGGRFALPSAPALQFVLTARLRGYAAASIVVAPRSAETANVRLRLIDSADMGWVRGRAVYSDGGSPTPGVTVELDEIDLSTITDSAGEYSLAAPSGLYRLVASGPGVNWHKQDSVLVRPQETTTVDLRLSALVHMERIIADENYVRLPIRFIDSYSRVHTAQQFALVRGGFAWPLATSERLTVNSRAFLHRAGRLELGHFAVGMQVDRWPTVMVGCRLFEWFDDGGTRHGQPAILPVYLTVADGPNSMGLFLRPSLYPVGQSLARRCAHLGIQSSYHPSFYAYVMGSASRSVGAGLGVNAPLRTWFPSHMRLTPGLELSWRHSWDGQSRLSTFALGVNLGLGDWLLPPMLFRV